MASIACQLALNYLKTWDAKMITTGMMYWLTRLDYINTTAMVILVATIMDILLLGIGFLCALSETTVDDENKKDVKKWFKRLFAILGLSSAVAIFTPTTKEMAAIYIIPAVAQNEDVAKMVKDVPSIMQLGTQWVKETLQDSVDKKVERRHAREHEPDRV